MRAWVLGGVTEHEADTGREGRRWAEGRGTGWGRSWKTEERRDGETGARRVMEGHGLGGFLEVVAWEEGMRKSQLGTRSREGQGVVR